MGVKVVKVASFGPIRLVLYYCYALILAACFLRIHVSNVYKIVFILSIFVFVSFSPVLFAVVKLFYTGIEGHLTAVSFLNAVST